MDIKNLAQKTKRSVRHIQYIFNGERKASPALALQLEEITGIDRRAWLWPDEYKNPMIKTQNQRAEPN